MKSIQVLTHVCAALLFFTAAGNTDADQDASRTAPTADQALKTCFAAYQHLHSYHCRIQALWDASKMESNPAVKALAAKVPLSAELWFKRPTQLRIQNGPSSFPPYDHSIYVRNGSSQHCYWSGSWKTAKSMDDGGFVSPTVAVFAELFASGGNNVIQAADGLAVIKAAAIHSSFSESSVDGRRCWSVVERTNGSIIKLSIDQRTYLLDRLTVSSVAASSHYTLTDTITDSEPNATLPNTLFQAQ